MKKLSILFLVLFCVLVCPVVAQSKNVSTATSQLMSLSTQINETLANLKQQSMNLQTQLTEAMNKLSLSRKQVKNLSEQITDLKTQSIVLQQQLITLKKELNLSQEQVKTLTTQLKDLSISLDNTNLLLQTYSQKLQEYEMKLRHKAKIILILGIIEGLALVINIVVTILQLKGVKLPYSIVNWL